MRARDDLTELRVRPPDLATRFSELRELLDRDPALTASADEASQFVRERHQLA
ncbi:hypothetical protein [Streptomyces sp. NPDC020667]|uniref:hypothetical protein n=1 Tax=Streptomyces sp. NPDC020667 TaxID=3154895 RepID=UPI003409626D